MLLLTRLVVISRHRPALWIAAARTATLTEPDDPANVPAWLEPPGSIQGPAAPTGELVRRNGNQYCVPEIVSPRSEIEIGDRPWPSVHREEGAILIARECRLTSGGPLDIVSPCLKHPSRTPSALRYKASAQVNKG